MADGIDLSKTSTGCSEELFQIRCTPCLEDGIFNEAEKYCIDCEMYYCKNCLRCHNRIPSLREHQIVDKSEPKDGRTKTALPTERCKTHHGKLNDMYCGDHDVVCCDTCIAVKHRTCVKVDYLPDVATGIKESQEFSDVKRMLRTVLTELQWTATKMLEDISSVEIENETILTETNNFKDDLISKIHTLAEVARDKWQVKHKQLMKQLKEDVNKLQSVIETISFIEQNMCNGNEAEVFAKVKSGKHVIKEAQESLSYMAKQRGHKKLNVILNDKIKASINTSDSLFIVEEKMYTAKLSNRYKMSGRECEISAACILNNTALILFDYSNCSLQRLALDDFRIIDQLEMKGYSYSICSVGTLEIAVALCLHTDIQIVSADEAMTPTRSISTGNYCISVAFNNISGEFLVSNMGNQLKVLNKEGQFSRKFENDETGKSFVSCSQNMIWSDDYSTMYITDLNKGLLAISSSGVLQWKYNDIELKGARGLCVLPDGVILVSGIYSNNVIQIDKFGKKIGTLLEAGDKLYHPLALAYDRKTSRLIVGQYSKIHVYNVV